MLMRWLLGLTAETEVVERAVAETLAAGIRTTDLAPDGAVSTARMGDAVCDRLQRQLDHLVEGGLTMA